MDSQTLQLQEIGGKLTSLRFYIEKIPESANPLRNYISRNEIILADKTFPGGETCENVVQNLQKFLPETIDKHLTRVSQYANAYSEEYKTHIRSECAAILEKLKTFRASCETTQCVTTPSANIYFVRREK